jgi:hypothetical protein
MLLYFLTITTMSQQLTYEDCITIHVYLQSGLFNANREEYYF